MTRNSPEATELEQGPDAGRMLVTSAHQTAKVGVGVRVIIPGFSHPTIKNCSSFSHLQKQRRARSTGALSARAARQGWPPGLLSRHLPVWRSLGNRFWLCKLHTCGLTPSLLSPSRISSCAHGPFRHIQACICSISSLLVFHQDLAIPVLPSAPHYPAVRPRLSRLQRVTPVTQEESKRATPQCRP